MKIPVIGRDPAPHFQRIVCWEPARVAPIMDREALNPDPEVFLATHSPLPLLRADFSGQGAQHLGIVPFSERELLQEVLSPEDFAFIAVLGGAGTGKSHLIRWLSTKITASPTRRVLLIPRSGTSLHEILRRLIEGLEGPKFEEYQHRLVASATAMTAGEACNRLLDNLALEIEQDVERAQAGGRTLGIDEQEDYALPQLPYVLRDPVFRPHFTRAGGVLARLAGQSVGEGGGERVDERRGFSEDDLRFSGRISKRASELAEEFVSVIEAEPDVWRPVAVRCLNRYLDGAVSALARMSGTDLQRLMRDVRAELATRGVELVILIEDLAALQGLDQQLLEALIVRPRQEGMEPLCVMRSVIGMTSGYFESLRPNIQQRFEFRVIMGEGEAKSTASAEDVRDFTARYFNATRLSAAQLDTWYADVVAAQRDGAEPPAVPSACSMCGVRAQCHAAFGAANGMGLYPLSAAAIDEIVSRVSPSGFNPRTQLRDAYKPLLENYAPALRNGEFPPEGLHRKFGSKLPVRLIVEINQRDPVDSARRQALLDLWGGGAQQLVDLHPGVHEAFSLPPLGVALAARPAGADDGLAMEASHNPARAASSAVQDEANNTATPALTPVVATPPATDPATLRLQEQLEALNRWSAIREPISQDLMQDLRAVVYSAVLATIDWNTLHLLPSAFSGSTAPFRVSNSINFEPQVLPLPRASVMLVLPLTGHDVAETAMALQALLQLRHHGDWDFPDGQRYYRAYLRQVAVWAEAVVAQLSILPTTRERWNPVPLLTEALATGARLHGLPSARDPDTADVVEAIFAGLPERDETGRSPEWSALAAQFRGAQQSLRSALLARVACSKGRAGEDLVQVIDTAQLVPVLSRVRRSDYGMEPLPSTLVEAPARSWERTLATLSAHLSSRLADAAEQEATFQTARLGRVCTALGIAEDTPPDVLSEARQRVLAAVRSLVETAAQAHVLQHPGRRAALLDAANDFETAQIQRWAEVIGRVRTASTPEQRLTEVSLVPVSPSERAIRFIDNAETVVAEVEETLSAPEHVEGDDVRTMITEVKSQIATSMRDLEDLLGQLWGEEHVATSSQAGPTAEGA